MEKHSILLLVVLALSSLTCNAQQTTPQRPDPPAPKKQGEELAGSSYTPPTQGERFKSYLGHTFGITSLVEAGVRAGIEQARNNPSQWPQGAEGYGDRFGSSMGQIAARGTTEFVAAEIFREDIRFIPRSSSGPQSRFKAALEDTFLARKGEDGHNALSIAHLVGPAAGSAIAVSAWYPSGYGGAEIARGAAISYGFRFVGNLLRELKAH